LEAPSIPTDCFAASTSVSGVDPAAEFAADEGCGDAAAFAMEAALPDGAELAVDVDGAESVEFAADVFCAAGDGADAAECDWGAECFRWSALALWVACFFEPEVALL
jgi:hypothetical protein